MGEWIKCSERMPEPEATVLVWEEWTTSPFVGWQKDGIWYADKEHYDCAAGWEGGVVIDRISNSCVTHWQPLPEPPTYPEAP